MLRSPTKCQCPDTDLAGTNVAAENVTQRKRKQPESEITEAINTLSIEINKKLDLFRGDLDGAINSISVNVTKIQSDLAAITLLTSEIKTELNSLRSDHSTLEKRVSDLDANLKVAIGDISQLSTSIQHTADDQAELKCEIASIRAQSMQADIINNALTALESKIDSLEQQARCCNLELCNVPEKRNENLIALLENIGSKISFSLSQKDIIAIHRVPHAHQDNKKPKNIIVKLSSRILRDNLLSSFRLAKGINSDQLGFSGNTQRIYMHEHLTLKKKQLFRETRDTARKYNFKYVWVKHATILVRETDTSSALAIRSSEDIKKIKPGTTSVISKNSPNQQSDQNDMS